MAHLTWTIISFLGATASSSSKHTGTLKHLNSAVVVWILPEFWWMISMGMKCSHTKCEPETQHGRPEMGFTSGGP